MSWNNNMNKQIETIRQACIRANPDITELKFGCELKRKRPLNKTQGWVITGGFLGIVYWNGNRTAILEMPGAYEIIGRPIRLADVLLAIPKGNNGYDFNTSANFLYRDGDVFWDIRKDDLTFQAPETIKFLYELLR